MRRAALFDECSLIWHKTSGLDGTTKTPCLAGGLYQPEQLFDELAENGEEQGKS